MSGVMQRLFLQRKASSWFVVRILLDIFDPCGGADAGLLEEGTGKIDTVIEAAQRGGIGNGVTVLQAQLCLADAEMQDILLNGDAHSGLEEP